jgi:hypothetical protein
MKKLIISGIKCQAVILFLVSAILSGCNRDRNNPGWDYFPDMFYSTAYETFSKNPNFRDGMTMRVPVAGTVPRGFKPFNYTIDPESRIKAGKELINPFLSSPENLLKGEKAYTTFCIGCHGSSGNGDGKLYTSGLYPLKPRSLTSENVVKLLDGEVYHSVILGFGSMGAHGSQITQDDRWKIILHIRQLQKEEKMNYDSNDSKDE